MIENLNNETNRQKFFIDISTLISNFSNLFKNSFRSDKQSTEITYAYIIQFVIYKTFVDNDIAEFKRNYIQFQQQLKNDLENQNFRNTLLIVKEITNQIPTNVYRPFCKEQRIINERIEQILEKPKIELSEVSPWLEILVFIEKYHFANLQNEILGFVYENYLKPLYNEKLGQYFTSPEISDFMLEQIGYQGIELIENVKKDQFSIIDPSCGSGAFLYGATRNLKNLAGFENPQGLITANIYGIDVADFPLYLAEMNIIMKMLPEKSINKINIFKTNDSLSEFLNLTESQLIDRKQFDYVIGNPPYISYNEAASQVPFFQLMREHKAKLSDVYGVNLHSVPQNRKKYPPKPNLYAFFIALGLSLLKDGGKLCYIVPQTLLTESDYDVLRYHLARYTKILKIITFNNPLFLGRGLKQRNTVSTSSLIFVVEKKLSDANNTEIINYKGSDAEIGTTISNIQQNTNTIKTTVNQDILLKNYLNWNFIKHEKDFIDFYNEYKQNSQDFDIYYDNMKAKQLFGNEFYFDVGFILDRKLETEQPLNQSDFELIDFKNFENFSNYSPTKYYPNSIEKIKLPKNSQGHKILKTKYKIVWNKERNYKFYFTDRNILPNMSSQQIISSDNQEEMYYLFALLNSKVNEHIFKKLFQVENEKSGLYIVVRRLKEFIKVPVITEKNIFLKKKIIEFVGELFESENISTIENNLLKQINGLTFALYFNLNITDFENFSEVLEQNKFQQYLYS